MKALRDILNEKILTVFAGILLATVLFLPYIKLSASTPGFEIVDLLLPVLGIIFLAKWKQFSDRKIYLFILFFGAYILLTIAVNGRLGQIKDHFEIVKLFKFGFIIALFSLVNGESFRSKWIPGLFVVLVILNMIHYFELFGFNDILEEYYQAGERLQRFGKNSLGMPEYKRMLGLLCNPNYNGILFILFSLFFLPKFNSEKINKLNLTLFAIALMMAFLCQSRTALLSATAVVLIYSIIFFKNNKRLSALIIITSIVSYFAASLITRIAVSEATQEQIFVYKDSNGNRFIVHESDDTLRPYFKNHADTVDGITYMGTSRELLLNNNQTLGDNAYMETLIDGTAFESYSMTGRLDIWKHMLDMWTQKPIFGYGPSKEYFYENQLYSESEFFSMLWRYGIIGLGFYVFFLLRLAYSGWKNLDNHYAIPLILSCVVMLVSSLTNNPFSHKMIIVVFGSIIGLYLAEKLKKRNIRLQQTKPKVCHLSTVHNPTDNRVFYKECASLAEKGYDIHLMVSGVTNKELLGVKIKNIKTAKKRFLRIIWSSFVMAGPRSNKLNCDIYHFHDTELIFAGLYLKLSGKKVIYDVHENNAGAIMSRAYLKNKSVKKFLAAGTKFTEKAFARFFDSVVTARPDISENFLSLKPVTLRNFPITPDYDSIEDIEIEKTKPAVIYVGGMTQIRGIKELIGAFANQNEFELWLLGPFSNDEFRKECTEVEGWNNVRELGTVEAFEIFKYIKKADIGICTFLPAPNHLTTLATKPFEYMACAKPIILSHFPYWQNFFQETASYVDPANSKDINETIKKMLSDVNALNERGQKNLELIRSEYNWSTEREKLYTVYARISEELMQMHH